MTKADLSKKPEDVSAMFDSVAASYDRTNDILSFGQARLWRKAVRKAVNPQPGQRILDLAAGTGTSSMALKRPGVQVVAADFSRGMLEEGRRRHPELEFAYADATKMPFQTAEFDAVTISFGLRNVQQPELALAEMFRVSKPGATLVICEFSHVDAWLRPFYRLYLNHVLPRLSALFSKAPEAYSYLADSINAWPTQSALAEKITAAGFTQVKWRNLGFGIVAVHTARRPQ